ncbi:MAG: NAD-dependent epimerase/dehydratase family protein, partial [Candidatus Dormibacteria bacterium]
GTVGAVVVVTSDKCYRPTSSLAAHREDDAMGGTDPYSASKACAELLVSSYRASFFSGGPLVATVRAGNVIGGGDWAAHRLVPDAMRALESRTELEVRYPDAVRPWQHVLEPLRGYLWVAEAAYRCQLKVTSLNFGPALGAERSVRWLLSYLRRASDGRLRWREGSPNVPETPTLRLDASLAERQLGWRPWLATEKALDLTYAWYSGSGAALARTLNNISFYEALNDCALPLL